MLSWESYYKREEQIAEGYCNQTRQTFGLGPCTGDEDCDKEVCRERCIYYLKEE